MTVWDNIKNFTVELANVISTRPGNYTQDKDGYCGSIVCEQEHIVLEVRPKKISDIRADLRDQYVHLEELHSWHQHQLPEMLTPILILEDNICRAYIMPLVFPDATIDETPFINSLAKYGLCGDISDTDFLSRNIGFLSNLRNEKNHTAIFDPGALRLLSHIQSKFRTITKADLETKKQDLEVYSPYHHGVSPEPKKLTPQIDMWRRRSYQLRTIYNQTEKFADPA